MSNASKQAYDPATGMKAQAELPPPRPAIARLVFKDHIPFMGGVGSVQVAEGLAAAAGAGGRGVTIEPARMTSSGPRALKDGEAYDGYLLSKSALNRSGPKPVQVIHRAFVGKENVLEVTPSSEQ